VSVEANLDGKVAIVTGSVTGFGSGIAKWLSKAGAAVIIADLNGEGAEKAAAEYVKSGLKAKGVQVNVTDRAQVDAMVNAAVSAFGGVDIMVNNAGYAQTFGPLMDVSEEEFDRIFQVNVKSIFHTTKAVVPHMRKRGRGVIINTASVAVWDGQIGQAAYSASKGGVVAMTLPLARELASSGIRVCTIAPGLFQTPMMATLPPDIQESLGKSVPFPQRLGRPEEYAALAQHIVENEMLNGETIRLDGALRLPPR